MIVVLVLIVMLVVSSHLQSALRAPALLRSEFQGAIDGGLAHSGIFLLDQAIRGLRLKGVLRSAERRLR